MANEIITGICLSHTVKISPRLVKCPRLVLKLVVAILFRPLAICQECKRWKPMTTRPAPRSELFRARADSESQCVHRCASSTSCQSLLYSGSECIGYIDHATDGEALDGTAAFQTTSKINHNGVSAHPDFQFPKFYIPCYHIISTYHNLIPNVYTFHPPPPPHTHTHTHFSTNLYPVISTLNIILHPPMLLIVLHPLIHDYLYQIKMII